MLSQKALQGYRAYTERELSHARYKIGSRFHEVLIEQVDGLSPTKIAVDLTIDPQASNDVRVTRIELIDNEGDVFIGTNENILIKAYQESVLYRFVIDFKEG